MELRPLATNVDGGDDETLDEETSTKRRPGKRAMLCYKVPAGLCSLLTVTIIVLVSRAFGIVGSLWQPYAKLCTTNNEDSVFPLIGSDIHFDVAVSIWQSKPCDVDLGNKANCSAESWGGHGWRSMMKDGRRKMATTTIPNVDEDLVFSEIVLRDFSLASKDRAVDLNFALPFKFRRVHSGLNRSVLVSDRSAVAGTQVATTSGRRCRSCL